MLIKPAKDSVDLLIFVNGIRKSLESGLLPGTLGRRRRKRFRPLLVMSTGCATAPAQSNEWTPSRCPRRAPLVWTKNSASGA